MADQSQVDRLRAIAKQMPELDAQAAQRQREALQATQINQVSGALQAGQRIGTGEAAAFGAQAAAQRGALAGQAAQQAGQTQLQLGGLALQAQQQADQTALATQSREQQQALQGQDLAAQQQLAEAGRDLSKRETEAELAAQRQLTADAIAFDDRLQTMTQAQRQALAERGQTLRRAEHDATMDLKREAGRVELTNQMQLLDYAALNAQSQEEFADRYQTVQQHAQRAVELQDRAYQVVTQQLAEAEAKAEQERDQASLAKIAEIRRALEEEKAEADRKSGAMKAIMQGAVGGAAAGAAFPPFGPIIGAVAGGAIAYAGTR